LTLTEYGDSTSALIRNSTNDRSRAVAVARYPRGRLALLCVNGVTIHVVDNVSSRHSKSSFFSLSYPPTYRVLVLTS
jgi:hypothetical protein